MKGNLSKIPPPDLQKLYKEEMDLILKVVGSVKPDLENGPYVIEFEDKEKVLVMSSKYFWSIFFAISRYISDKISVDYSLTNLIKYLKDEQSLFPSQSEMTLVEFKNELSKEYIFIGMQRFNIIAPVFQELKKNKYIQGGILHFLAYHYRVYNDALAKNKKKTLFPEHVTINEIIGALISVAKNGTSEVQGDGKIKIKGTVILNLPYHHNSSDNYRLILEPIKQHNLMCLTTFFKE
jgi:hypothetical protein